MLSKARRMSQEETRQAVWVSFACSRASTICAVVGAESVLGGVEELVGFPCVADAVCQNAGP